MASGHRFLGGYVRRLVDDELDVLLEQLPAVLLDGAKAVGKTATATRRARTIRRLDNPAEHAIVEADASVLALGERPILVDEWHRIPQSWDVVRALVDADHSAGQFLLTGSPPGPGTHSGAGRITTVRMRPLSLFERGVAEPTVSFGQLLAGGHPKVAGVCPLALADYVDEIVAGGFPGLRHLTGRALTAQLDGYLERIVDHDLAEAGFVVRRPATIRAWMRAYAAATGTTATWETIRDAATAGIGSKPAKDTTITYTELLRSMGILDPLEAWLPSHSHLTRLTAGPKHHLADPALAVRALGLDRRHLLSGDEGPIEMPRDGTLLGALFESLATLSVRAFSQAGDAHTYHLRDRGGRHEVDLIVEKGARVLAIEVKLTSVVDTDDVRHLRWLGDQIGGDLVDAVVLTTGPEAYRRPDGIAVVPLGALGP